MTQPIASIVFSAVEIMVGFATTVLSLLATAVVADIVPGAYIFEFEDNVVSLYCCRSLLFHYYFLVFSCTFLLIRWLVTEIVF